MKMKKEIINPFVEKINIEDVFYDAITKPKNVCLVFNRKGEFMVSIGKMEYYPTDQGPLKEWDFETKRTVKPDEHFKYVAEDMCAEIYEQI